jgi:ABC-2 type transport system permease protein
MSAPGAEPRFGGTGILLWLRWTDLRNRLTRGERSWFKIGVVTAFGLAFWGGLFQLFSESFSFLSQQPELRRDLTQFLLAIFFFFLGLMLVFSNAIISWTSLFRSSETAFLMASPVREEHLFSYKFLETLWFSSWAFLFLGTPLMAAYGRSLALGPGFYLGATLLIGVFIFIPAALGNIAALLIGRFVPRLRRRILVIAGGGLLGLALFVIYQILTMRGYASPISPQWMRSILSNLQVAQSPLCPSYWVAGGITALAQASRPSEIVPGANLTVAAAEARWDVFLYGLAIFANALFFTTISHVLARLWFFESWCAAQASDRRRRFPESRVREAAWDAAFAFLPARLRLLMLKDLRSFVRDPVQWSQFLIFFGLLAVYFLNLRSFAYHVKIGAWKALIALLNLCATSLTLSTFTTRFVFPQLSLEGKRFWLLGVAPTSRSMVVAGKFLFSFVGSVIVSESLILTSSTMLQVSGPTVALQAVATVAICFGLSGLSVGLGAVFPNFREDNPSKIVSSFGGTLNLILSLAFVSAMIAITAWFGRSMLVDAGETGNWRPGLAGGIAALVGFALAAGGTPLFMGLRAIRKLEL